MLKINSLVLSCFIAFFLFGELFAVNLSCDARLRECEAEVKSLLKKNAECSSDLDSLKMEISHLSEMVSHCERNMGATQDPSPSISWGAAVGQLRNFFMFFKGAVVASYSNIPKELDSHIKSIYAKLYAYLGPMIDKYSETYPMIVLQTKSLLNKYVNLLSPYAEHVQAYSELINNWLDKYVAKIESYEPHIAGTIPKSFHDRVFYILCAILALYVILESFCIALRLVFRCCGIRCNSSANKKNIKSPSSKSTPSNRRK
ncbi:putative signal peptide-containing protein [Cryptosporidium canis]|uniref:Signal peptide-containing protein n=1 Tax=Cryptosporidium canis TaxID=195482 RepID=A0ABQ8P853_9CRYT|nr:putative signal peptide-containing protein [Cryptosporidium canis]KAJ1614429.1 putative signal peptide-containing protein [Cryptosporidium canis]